MDPVANLERQRELVRAILSWAPGEGQRAKAQAAGELAELVQSLDEWRLSGGFDPYIPATEFPVGAESYYGQQFEEGR